MSLAFGESIFADPAHLVVTALREQDAETRRKVIGLVEGRLWIAIYVERGTASGLSPSGEATMQKHEHIIAIPADPDDAEDFDVSEDALEQGLRSREARLNTPEQVTLRIDRAVLARFRAAGPDWEARINAALRAAQP